MCNVLHAIDFDAILQFVALDDFVQTLDDSLAWPRFQRNRLFGEYVGGAQQNGRFDLFARFSGTFEHIFEYGSDDAHFLTDTLQFGGIEGGLTVAGTAGLGTGFDCMRFDIFDGRAQCVATTLRRRPFAMILRHCFDAGSNTWPHVQRVIARCFR